MEMDVEKGDLVSMEEKETSARDETEEVCMDREAVLGLGLEFMAVCKIKALERTEDRAKDPFKQENPLGTGVGQQSQAGIKRGKMRLRKKLNTKRIARMLRIM